MRVVSIVGARPQFVKAAVVSREIRARAGLEERLVHTGQHYDPEMSERFFEELELPAPDRWLGVGSGSHGRQTARMLVALEDVLEAERPDQVVVYGDTNSTLAGALVAAKLGIPVAHVEAGLRSFAPFMAEEINRVLTDRVAALLFTPTATASENLRREGFPPERILQVGDVMFDVCRTFGERAARKSGILEQLGLAPGGFVLATFHRAENTDDPARLGAVLDGLMGVAETMPVVVPLHPRTRKALAAGGLLERADAALRLLPPVGYLDVTRLLQNARLLATDSGGLQKEAFFHGVPCVTLRDETEWTELVASGWNRLLPPGDAEALRKGLLAAVEAPPPASRDVESLYGDGHAAARIAEHLAHAAAPATSAGPASG